MRSIIFVASSALLALPLLASSPPARADNDFMGQAQRFFNGNSNSNEDAYRRGREDEMRRQQADREDRRARREREREWSRYERDRDARY